MTYPKTRRLMLTGALSALSVLGLAMAASPASAAAIKPAAVTASAARSVHVTLQNTSVLPLTRKSVQLSSGIWSGNQLPPEQIAAASTGSWQNESHGAATGAVGQAIYGSSAGNFTVTWDNPYIGSNSYSCTAPAGHLCGWNGGGGNNASVTFFLI